MLPSTTDERAPTARCPRCEQDLALTAFGPCSSRSSGRRAYDRACESALALQRYRRSLGREVRSYVRHPGSQPPGRPRTAA
jgi:hypothetical protein